MRRPRLTRTDVVLSCISAAIEATAVCYVIHRKGWFRA